MKNTILFSKDYDYEGLYDLERDLGESINGTYNPLMDAIPSDEHGMLEGTFKVTVEWVPEGKE